MHTLTRRAALGGLGALSLARPAILHAQSTSKPVKIGLLSDMNVGRIAPTAVLGAKIAAQIAVEDFGDSVLGRKIEILQADDQNKPDVASGIARQMDRRQRGVDALADGSATSSGPGRPADRQGEAAHLPASAIRRRPISHRQAVHTPWSFQFAYDTYALANATGGMLTKVGGSTCSSSPSPRTTTSSGYSLQKNTETFHRGGRRQGAGRGARRRWRPRISPAT